MDYRKGAVTMSFLFKKQINHEYANEPYEVAYITNFEDSDGDSIVYLQDVNGGTYSDDGTCTYLLSLETDDWDQVAEHICKRYGCELDVETQKLVAKEDYILVQTMLAIYAWIEFKECGL
jgi:hypothetical protein